MMREKFAQMNICKKKLCGFKGVFAKKRIGIGSAKAISELLTALTSE
jgi:hypothetical protein